MSNPVLTIRKDERTAGGSLSVRHVDILAGVLSEQGYVLLPSDTAYSLAAQASHSELQQRLNKILNRPDWPVSLAFPSARIVREWMVPNLVVDHLMEQFCPGPVTIVCQARSPVPARFFDGTIASQNRTIGVRIPDSIVEREVASCGNFPITTAAVREGRDGPAVCEFERALSIVSAGMESMPGVPWCAIEGGEIKYPAHSTVVEVSRSGGLREIRPGAIPFEDLEASVAVLPRSAFGDRG
jgi:L-threonylcarbamoyladenylate synthase